MSNDITNTRDELATKAKFELVWTELRRLGISQVSVTFSGEGDSGSINDVSIGQAESQHWVELNEALDKARVDMSPDEGVNPNMRLIDLIAELTDPLTTGQGVDWWNGDGGFGECTWFVNDDPPRIELSISERIVHTNDHSYELDKYGEEIE